MHRWRRSQYGCQCSNVINYRMKYWILCKFVDFNDNTGPKQGFECTFLTFYKLLGLFPWCLVEGCQLNWIHFIHSDSGVVNRLFQSLEWFNWLKNLYGDSWDPWCDPKGIADTLCSFLIVGNWKSAKIRPSKVVFQCFSCSFYLRNCPSEVDSMLQNL